MSEAFRDWARASIGYLVRLGPIMIVAGFASGLAIQWLSREVVAEFLGNDVPEEINVPYFDGFIGAVDPFFLQESVDADLHEKARDMLPPRGWTRLWKVHGSIGWCIKNVGGTKRIVRASDTTSTGELIIHPSRDKYVDSRKPPFMTYLVAWCRTGCA